MTNKIQTKKVVLILVGLVIVSVLGTAAYFSSTGRLNFHLSPTGLATESGFVALEIGQVLDITMVDTAINLSLHPTDTAADSTGYVNPAGGGTATINSEGTNDGNWLNVTGAVARAIQPDYIVINNSGSVNVTLTVGAAADAQAFFGAGALEAFFIKVLDNQTADETACTGESTGYIAYGEVSGTGANGSDTVICPDLNSTDLNDQLNLTIQWIIPAGAGAGDGLNEYNSTLTFTATKASG